MAPVPTPSVSFFDAWVGAASGRDGFWRAALPSEHFRTASTLGPELAAAVATLLAACPEVRRVLEVGAGDGALLNGLRAYRSDLELVGVDLRTRPAGLDPAVGWATDRWDVHRSAWSTGAVPALLDDPVPTLVLALEWLDDLPCRVAAPAHGGWRELDADLVPAGPLPDVDRAWVERWWPHADRAEVGTTRDAAWSALVRGLRAGGGAALLVDYGHLRDDRPAGGSLAAYRAGRAVEPRPRPDRNLTAHVALDAVAAAGTAAGARTVLAGCQQQVLPGLLPALAATEDPLARLSGRSRRHALTTPAGWGGHGWLMQEVPAGAVAT